MNRAGSTSARSTGRPPARNTPTHKAALRTGPTRKAGGSSSRGSSSSSSSSSKAGKPALRAAGRAPGKRGSAGTRRRSGRSSLLVVVARALWRAVSGLWLLLARAVGSAVRAVGRGAANARDGARDLDRQHRRDGIGLALLGLAIVVSVAVWAGGAGPVGTAVRVLFTWA
ncbi:MAG: hypothetical protein ACR2KN_07735, partial [Geodermatophilaceae bacterium]